LGIAFLLGIIVAAFGWIMVASGLVSRPWVNAYKLTVHLNLALLLYAWLFWVAIGNVRKTIPARGFRTLLSFLTVAVVVQLILGGLMSGMKAGLYYPTWPDMHGEFFPRVLLDAEIWSIESVVEYERGLVPGLVQFLHRTFAYLILILSLVLYLKARRQKILTDGKIVVDIVLLCVIIQVGLGIATVINCIGRIPIGYGVAHQAFAILLLSSLLFLQKKIQK
jgi:cytochrome c oxidase assembly protein subunit 15